MPTMTATLAHVRQRYTLLAICNECAHMVELDVGGLIDTLGPDHPVPDCSNLYDDGFFRNIMSTGRITHLVPNLP